MPYVPRSPGRRGAPPQARRRGTTALFRARRPLPLAAGIVAWRAHRVFRRAQRRLDANETPDRFALEGVKSAALAALGPAIAALVALIVVAVAGHISASAAASAFFAVALIGGLITFVTGMLYLPLIYHHLLRRLVLERREIANLLLPSGGPSIQ